MTQAADFSGFIKSAALNLPQWTTAGRPATPANGMAGYNTTNNTFEVYQNGAWNGYVAS